MPGHHDGVGRGMTAVFGIQVPHHGVAVQLFREVRHLIGKLNAWQRGVDDTKIAPNIGSGLGLRVQCVVMAGASASPDQNAVNVAAFRIARQRACCLCFSLKKLWQRQAEGAERTNIDHKLPTTVAFAIRSVCRE